MNERRCHNCEEPILVADLAFADCPARCEGGDLPYHYRCVTQDKRSAAKKHTPDNAVLVSDRRFMKWARRMTGE